MVSDEWLYEQLLGGDLKAFDVLYARYERHLFGFIFAQVRDRQEAEDILHDAVLAVLHERRSGRSSPRCFRAWIYKVARNLCLNRVRKRQRAARATDAAAQLADPPTLEPEGEIIARQSSEALRRAVARLPEPLAELFRLRSGGLSYEELSEVLDIPLGTVKSRMHELMVRLRAEVQP
jgi:RNA polymerase sigma-70 factor, ECF subfamily